MTVNEYLEGAIELNLSLAAHTTYWALINGFVSPEDEATKLFNIPLDEAEINRLTDQNILGVEKVKLYVVETQKKDVYAFYFAEDALAASYLHRSLFNENAVKVTNGRRLWANPMHFLKHDNDMTFFEYRKHFVEFPAYIGHAFAKQSVCYYLVQGGISA